MKRHCIKAATFWLAAILVLVVSQTITGQTIRGAIEGSALDPTGAVIPGANVTLQNVATGAAIKGTTNERGAFSFQNLEAGNYRLTVEKGGFRKYLAKEVSVRVGNVTPVMATLEVGDTNQVVEVTSSTADASVDTSRSTVDGVITAKQIDNLPLNGRNFLDLAQLEPGVQTRDGGDFDPTKNQMAGASIGGRSGRSTRIQVDGVDITDENVGTTTTNISNESIQEFQVSRSTLDASTDLTTSGAINIVSRSGSNQFHGAGFGFFRDAGYASDLRLDKTSPTTEKPAYERQNFGGRMGGFLIKDKLFWHAEVERNRQNGQQFTSVTPFPQFTGNFPVPLRETVGGARLDYHVTSNLKAFYRFNHDNNSGVTGFGGINLAAFANQNNTNSHVTGLDYAGSRWTHSGRFSYLNFNNAIVAGNAAAGTPVTLDPAGKPLLVGIVGQLQVGPNPLAPQQTFQDNYQTKYDGSVVTGNHTLRIGGAYNALRSGGLASFFANAVRIRGSYNATTIAFANANGGASNPLNFPLLNIRLGNGLGFASEKPAHGLPFGGFNNDRLGFYAQDAWRLKRNLSVTLGLRYVYDSNLANNDLPRTPILAQFSPTLAGKVKNPAANFSPQLGFAWDLHGDGKTVIRAGTGLYYETNIINNVYFDRPLNLPPGLGNDTPILSAGAPIVLNPATGACLFDVTHYNAAPGNCTGGTRLLGQPLKTVIAAAQNIQANFQAATAALAAKYSPTTGPSQFALTLDTPGSAALVYNDYKRPYSMMFNVGFQRELKDGLVLSVDYLRNRGVHFNQLLNLNRLGAANTLNVAAARSIIAATNDAAGCGNAFTAAAINCAIGKGKTIADYANNGLDAGSALDGFAFQGNNPNFRNVVVVAPVGLSTYNALTVNLRGRLKDYGPVKGTTVNISYALSRFNSTGLDQDFLSASVFNDSPTKFYGPAVLDRTHQLSVSFLSNLPWGFKLNSTTRWATALPSSIFVPTASASGAGEIFFTDFDGDGTVGDPLPGTNRGAFGRSVKIKDLNGLLTSFNNTVTNTLTPAAQALVTAGLFTQAQLTALHGTVNNGGTLPLAPANAIGLDSFFNTDIRFSKEFRIKEHVRIEPLVEVFNLFNIGNYDPPANPLFNQLDGATGSINGTTKALRSNRYGLGSGSFTPGIPRAFQFGFRVEF
ncbi:MAG: TonB-dependent receptor [Acidobacteria bacterium]|nr:TonB-dependent receptor [Acidobacteriota bacterium]MBI3422302.1 TonB-dependent receptor [Acidobacteriota bacterium]